MDPVRSEPSRGAISATVTASECGNSSRHSLEGRLADDLGDPVLGRLVRHNNIRVESRAFRQQSQTPWHVRQHGSDPIMRYGFEPLPAQPRDQASRYRNVVRQTAASEVAWST